MEISENFSFFEGKKLLAIFFSKTHNTGWKDERKREKKRVFLWTEYKSKTHPAGIKSRDHRAPVKGVMIQTECV